MTEGSGKAREIDLGADFGDVVVKANGARVKIGADGSLQGVAAPANDTALKATLEIGDEMGDGTILAGISPDTGMPIYATPADAPLTYRFNQARKYASKLEAHGHRDWRVPSKGELNVLWESRNKGKLAGTFNVTPSFPDGWYWSSSTHGRIFTNGWAQCFSDHGGQDYCCGGRQDYYCGIFDSSLRCVRG